MKLHIKRDTQLQNNLIDYIVNYDLNLKKVLDGIDNNLHSKYEYLSARLARSSREERAKLSSIKCLIYDIKMYIGDNIKIYYPDENKIIDKFKGYTLNNYE